MFFRRETSYSDICFLISLFLTYHSSSILRSNYQLSNASIASSLPSNMKSLPLISLAAVSTMTLSPLMMALWTVQGSGNANFPFFQALALWTFFALAIIEFSNQVMSEIDNDIVDIDPNISDLDVKEYEKQNLIKKG
jgi:GPI transamidase subunit PIG-U